MAPNTQVVVTLKLPSEKLKQFDFSANNAPGVKKPRKRAAGSTGKVKKSELDDNGEEDSKQQIGSSASVGVLNSGADPVLGNLPRSLKAAPVANTAGLVLDKTPCRKWIKQVVELRTISGYPIGVKAWTSSYTEEEWEQKLKQAAEEEQAAAAAAAAAAIAEDRADTPEASQISESKSNGASSAKKPIKPRKPGAKKPGPKRGSSKLKDAKPLKVEEFSVEASASPARDTPEIPDMSTVDASIDQSVDVSTYPSDNSSDPQSEPTSEAPSEPVSEAA